MEQPDNIKTLLNAGAAAVQPVIAHGGIPFVAVPEGYAVRDLESLLPTSTPEAAVALFRDYLARRTEIVEEAREELKGRSLACWCPLGQPCHADVLLELANQGQAMTEQCTQRQVELLHHTLGLSIDHRDPYRNHFVAGPGHHDMPDLEVLEALGLMARSPTPKFCADGDIVFRVTDAGRAVALDSLPPPPKPTRYGE